MIAESVKVPIEALTSRRRGVSVQSRYTRDINQSPKCCDVHTFEHSHAQSSRTGNPTNRMLPWNEAEQRLREMWGRWILASWAKAAWNRRIDGHQRRARNEAGYRVLSPCRYVLYWHLFRIWDLFWVTWRGSGYPCLPGRAEVIIPSLHVLQVSNILDTW